MDPAARRITVLVVDDDDRFRQMILRVLAREPDIAVVGQAADAERAVALVEQILPDVVLLDLTMPTGAGTGSQRAAHGGLEAAATISRGFPSTRIVMLTASDSESDVFDALRAGVHGYVFKGDLSGDLAGVVRTMAGDLGMLLSPSIASRVRSQMTAGPASPSRPALSGRELQILDLVGRGNTNDQIAKELYLSGHTVKRHVANILAKLHQPSRADAVLHAVDNGYLAATGRRTPPA